MRPGRKWMALTVVACAALATVAALPAAFQAGGGRVPAGAWLLVTAAAVVAALCLFASPAPAGSSGSRPWSRSVAAMSLATLAPLAVESNLHWAMAHGAFVLTAAATAIAFSGSGAPRIAAAVIATASACALDATALLWPVGCAWASLARKRRRTAAGAMLAAGLLGVIIARLIGWPILSGCRTTAAAHAIHRDLMLLLPVLALGWAGYAKGWGSAFRSTGGNPSLWMPGWAAAGAIGLILALIGLPLEVRICVLPLWWYVPLGLSDLARLSSDRSKGQSLIRRVGMLACLAIAVLSLAGLRRWMDGLLMGLYLLTANG